MASMLVVPNPDQIRIAEIALDKLLPLLQRATRDHRDSLRGSGLYNGKGAKPTICLSRVKLRQLAGQKVHPGLVEALMHGLLNAGWSMASLGGSFHDAELWKLGSVGVRVNLDDEQYDEEVPRPAPPVRLRTVTQSALMLRVRG